MVEIGGIVILGIFAQWIAWRLKIPAILPLIITGLVVGPVSQEFFSLDGEKWIEPIWNGKKGLFPGESLYYFVSLAIGIILFEGGLTLRKNEIRNVAPVITKLITLGSLVTFICSGFVTHFLFNLDYELSFLFAALIIVTGPTVIAPILRNIPLKKDVSTVLKWEGILIDPLGALSAVLVFDFISIEEVSGFTQNAFLGFAKIVFFGSLFGFVFAKALAFAINKKLIPHYLLNVVSLSAVLLVFIESEIVAHESGLLSVVVMGMVLGNSNLKNYDELLSFKESLSVLLISMLFILLAANVNMEDLILIFRWETLVLFSIVVFIIRPLAVFVSTYKSSLQVNERLFISWVGPRGIVAAGIASLFGTKLMKQGVMGAEYITPLVFTIVLGTVLLNATTARKFARILKVVSKKSTGILIVGASDIARLIATYLENTNRQVYIIDNNPVNIQRAKNFGLNAISLDIYDDEDILTDDIELNDVGYLLCLTASPEINNLALEKFSEQFGENGSFRLISYKELLNDKQDGNNPLFSKKYDFNILNEIALKYPIIHELDIVDEDYLISVLKYTDELENTIPLFIKDDDGKLHVITYEKNDLVNVGKYSQLIYLGKKLDL